jgi:hypothetical protein
MVSTTQQSLATTNQLAHVTRPARALIGWMSQQEGQLFLAGRQIQNAQKPEYITKVQEARAAVQKRQPGVDQSELLAQVPPELQEYLTGFQSQDAFKPFADEKWLPKIADLRKVCALQPVVFSDHAEERATSADPEEMLSIAKITLPIPDPTEIPLQYDQSRNTWMITSRNPNLKIVGNFSAPIQGFTGCGFLVAVSASFVQVVLHRGRYLLRDGYHRSLGLLARGITNVPVLYREFSEYENLGLPAGMLQAESYLGERPPLLEDYLNNDVASEVLLPASQKMIVVQGMEMNPLG